MPSLNIDLNFSRHPKVIRTRAILPDPFEADHFFQSLMRLWEYVGNFHPEDGGLNGYNDTEVEGLAGWKGNPGRFLRVAIEKRWLDKVDNSYFVHDWEDHEAHIIVYRERARAAAKGRYGKRPANRKSLQSPPLNPDASSTACESDKHCLTTALHCTALSVSVKEGSGEDFEEIPPPVLPPWSRADFDAAAKNLGPEAVAVADELWSHLDAQGWQWGNNMKVQGDPRSALTRWLSKAGPKAERLEPGKTAKREVWKIENDIKSLEAEIRLTTARIDARRPSCTDDEWMANWRKVAAPEDVALREKQRGRMAELKKERSESV